MSTPVQTALRAFVWHDHASRDPERAKQFYAELFGWQTEARPDINYTIIVDDGRQHGGFWPPAEEDLPPGWIGHVLVNDVDATAGRAEAAGGSVLFGGPMDAPEGRRFAVVRDPEGAVVSAYSSPGESTPPQGVFGWDELIVEDVEAAKSFYSEVFGWTTSEIEMGAGRTYTILNSGDQQRAGVLQKPPGVQASLWLVYIISADVDADAAKAKELGAQVFMEPFDVQTVGRLAILADPTGAPFGLFKGEQ
jgi:predicted enzyme related to lactoylglutathione lyase